MAPAQQVTVTVAVKGVCEPCVELTQTQEVWRPPTPHPTPIPASHRGLNISAFGQEDILASPLFHLHKETAPHAPDLQDVGNRLLWALLVPCLASTMKANGLRSAAYQWYVAGR